MKKGVDFSPFTISKVSNVSDSPTEVSHFETLITQSPKKKIYILNNGKYEQGKSLESAMFPIRSKMYYRAFCRSRLLEKSSQHT